MNGDFTRWEDSLEPSSGDNINGGEGNDRGGLEGGVGFDDLVVVYWMG